MLRALELVSPELLKEAERRLSNETHYMGINDRAQRLRKRHSQWQRDRSYVAWDLQVW
jgi:hypothetical protein